MAYRMLLERYFRRLGYAATNGKVRSVFELDLKKKDEIAEKLNLPKEEELRVTAREETEIEQSAERGLAEVMRILPAVLRQPDFGQDDVQPGGKVYG